MPEIDWNIGNTWIVSTLFSKQVARVNHPNTCLNSVDYTEVEKGFKERTGLVVTRLHLKNKWDKLKEDFKVWRKLELRQIETGWGHEKGTICMYDDWWKKARADITGCGKFRKLGLQNEDELARCFGGITNIGVDHWSPHGANIETNHDANVLAAPVEGGT